ncbi:hypothetical protein PILCRDRAFT_13863 [Piloderma croceum F 1598]|uniref:Uncharacterized protein n=1 Tax=Piloderma croceum (strain F 1598) TaxID=765440 RepID=A0A0C3F5N6_PILCF|nr:hypothetical protein PILCRDRAFT_13863 [Piloderma croceum F 1598]
MYPAAQSIVLVKRTTRRTRCERRSVVEESTDVRVLPFQLALPFMGNLPGVPFQIRDFVFWWEWNVILYGYVTAFLHMGDGTIIAWVKRYGYYASQPGAIVLLPTAALNSLVP